MHFHKKRKRTHHSSNFYLHFCFRIVRCTSICFLIAILSVTVAHISHIHSKCSEQCDLYRPPGSKEAYVLLCDNYSLPVQKRAECRSGCSQCPTLDICDYRMKPVQIYCPATDHIEGACKRRCDYQRPEGNFGEYSFSCEDETLFPSPWDVRQCRNDCKECPSNVCDYIEIEYDCPAVNETVYVRPPPPPPEPPYEGICESRCDKDRPPKKSRVDGYKLICYQKYEDSATATEQEACIHECASCPLNICDAENYPGIYKCPKSRPVPLPDPPKPGTFIVSWIVIGLIAVAVIGCMLGTTFFGRIRGGGAVRPQVRQRSILDTVVVSVSTVDSEDVESLDSDSKNEISSVDLTSTTETGDN